MTKLTGLFILILICLFNIKSSAQSVTEILTASSDSLRKIKITQYKVFYKSSIPGLQEKNIEARIVAERSIDSLFGMKFLVNQDSFEYIYDGRLAFELNHGDRKVKQLNPVILKQNGFSDLLVKELFQGYEKEAFHGQITGSDDSNKYDAITYTASNEGRKTIKKIFINRLTGIPEKFESVVGDHRKKEVTVLTLSEVVINAKNIPRVDTRILAYLDKYTLLPVEDIGMPAPKDARDSLVGQKAPYFELKTLGDKSVKLSDYSGNLVLLDFWEVWCGPCRMSIPHLQELHNKYKEKGLVILGITKDNIMASRGLLASRNITYMNLAGSKQVTEDYKVLEIPQYYLIDNNGFIIYASKNGFEKKLEDMIEMLLK